MCEAINLDPDGKIFCMWKMKISSTVFCVAAYDLAGGQNNQDYGNQPAGGDDHGFQQSYHYTIDEGAELEYTCYR